MIRFAGLFLFAAFVALLIFVGAWYWNAPRPEPPTPAPLPTPGPVTPIEPEFSSLSGPLLVEELVQWKQVYALAALSKAAYLDADGQKAGALELGADRVTPLANRSSEGFVASDENAVVISFRGTADARDLITDILGFPSFMEGGVMHRGFSRAIDAIYRDAIEAAMDHGADKKLVWITGHSLGGALACGFSLQASKKQNLNAAGVVTFGQPLVMSDSLCRHMLDAYGTRYIRIVNGIDPVTTLVNLYRHSGARAQLQNDGTYDWRPPMIATTAPGDRDNNEENQPANTPAITAPNVIEPNEELKLISEEEARELEQQILAAEGEVSLDEPDEKIPGLMKATRHPLSDHWMAGYLSRLRDIVERKMERDSEK